MNLLITGAWLDYKNYITCLEDAGHEICFMQNEVDTIPCDYEWVEGVVCNGLFLTHPIEKFTNLKYIQLTSSGLDRIPMDYIDAHGIVINNARGVYSIPMAEFAVAGVLSLYKQMQFFADNQKMHKWEKNRDLLELNGKKVCIWGLGSVGQECKKRFEAFGCDVYRFDGDIELLSKIDILILSMPLNSETYHVVNQDVLDAMKPGSILVNIARGGLVDTNALIHALQHKLGGAVLDVFEGEPLDENNPLWDMENVILTPHNSFVGEGNGERLSRVIVGNLA